MEKPLPDRHTDIAFRHMLLAVGALLLVLIGIAWTIAPDPSPAPFNTGLARYFLMRQDLVGILAVECTIGLALFLPGGAGRLPMPRLSPRALAIGIAIVMLVSCWVGARLVFSGYALSRDEQLVAFDAGIFASGRLFATIPANMRDLAEALNQIFILPIGDHDAWVSAYLPMNAAIRAVFLRLGDATLAAPVLVAVGAIALWRIAARLWPKSRNSQMVALLLYAGSSQIWVTGMTAYAMNAHLALNLLWLWLFLKDRPSTHAVAILVGFVATGLHQIVFHPLFVLPFLDMLLRQKRWRLLATYCAAYAVIGAFWIGWPLWIAAHGVASATDVAGSGFIDRYVRGLSGLRLSAVGIMAANLVRFAAWQHLLLLPLAGYGLYRFRGADPVVRALAVGLLLPIVVTFVVLPYQGHGWGYRYLHGVIGSACLLGGYGWRELEKRRETPVKAMIVATLASILVMLPVHAVMAHRLVSPFSTAAAKRDAAPAGLVIIDDESAPFAQDLVLNPPDLSNLSNRPLVLAGHAVRPDQMIGLCGKRSIAFMDSSRLASLSRVFGGAPPVATPNYVALQEAARAGNCRVAKIPD